VNTGVRNIDSLLTSGYHNCLAFFHPRERNRWIRDDVSPDLLGIASMETLESFQITIELDAVTKLINLRLAEVSKW